MHDKLKAQQQNKLMTKKEAKELTIELWEWLHANPTKGKEESPMWAEVEGLYGECALCQLYYTSNCNDCPLDAAYCCCFDEFSPFDNWSDAVCLHTTNPDKSKAASREILEIVKEWDVDCK